MRPDESFPLSDWPLHITVLPPFHTDAAASVIARIIAGVIAATPSGGTALTAFTGPGFRAHITIKNGNRVPAGDVLTLSQIALVDMAPRSAAGGRTVHPTFPLPAVGPVPGSAEPVFPHVHGPADNPSD